MAYIKLRKLNEDHEGKLPAELLDMSVRDMLDRVGTLDTAGDAEYEIVEDALIAIKDKILGDGYASDEVNFTPDNAVEDRDDEKEHDAAEDERDEDFPTFDQATNDGNSADSAGAEGQGGFEF